MAGRCCLYGLLAPVSPGFSSTWLPHPHAKVWEKSGPSAGRLDHTVTFSSQDIKHLPPQEDQVGGEK